MCCSQVRGREDDPVNRSTQEGILLEGVTGGHAEDNPVAGMSVEAGDSTAEGGQMLVRVEEVNHHAKVNWG